jgi:hypothetical protein
MPMSTTAQQRFDERVTARALADTLVQLSPRRTISPRTLIEAGITLSLVDGGAPAASFENVPHTATANLPRIALEHRAASGQAPNESANAAEFEAFGILGEGGMGRVLLARQHSLARDVAIKTLKEGDESASFASELLREARITGMLEHPGIVPVHALGLDKSDLPLLVMKRIDGVSFRVLLDDASHPAWKSVSAGAVNRVDSSIEILLRVCQSLAFAHSRGIVHRDIKPENIMIGDYGEIYLCDWGVATRIDDALSSAGSLVGTLAYMAPEMLLGDAVSTRTDVYLLGATLHEVLTGRVRHDGASMYDILQSISISAPFGYDSTVAPELARLCNQSTSSDPEQRPASADAFRKELAEYLHQRSAMAICDAALERVHALEGLLSAVGSGAVPGDLAAAYRHATEARFGFAQSARVCPNLAVAQQGLERMLVALFDLELRQGHVESAAALLDELTTRPPELVNRLAIARKEAEAHRLETERLRAIARDLDPTVAARSRMLFVSAIGICCLGLALGILVKFRGSNITPKDLVVFAAVSVASTLVVLGVLRRRVGETLFNRRMAAFLCCSVGFLLFHRLLALHAGQTVSQILFDDTLLFLAEVFIGTVTFQRRLIVMVAVLALTLIAMVIDPEGMVWYFQWMSMAVVPAVIWAWKTPHDPTTSVPSPT